MRNSESNRKNWQFFIDRGGTFTDIIAWRDDGLLKVHKLLSERPRSYEDAAVQGIRDVLALADGSDISSGIIDQVRLGTTVATNALLERRGEPTVLVVNQGFSDALRIAYQNRPDLFARKIVLPDALYAQTIEVPGRVSAQGEELESFDRQKALELLQGAVERGMKSCAIVFMHGYKFPQHEEICAELARQAGFKNVATSNATSPLIKLVSRGDTTVADAYLSPILMRYLDRFSMDLQSTSIYFMQSNGGLTDKDHFRGKDSLLSGPAGGVVGAAETAKALGFTNVISFDMGGTSTDVSYFQNEFERQEEHTISGIRIRAPMIAVHTIAAGGGSILRYDGHRFLVGPQSAGSDPGPACYRNGGPLTVTDANLLLGRIQSEYFPNVFGDDGRQPLDDLIVRERFNDLKKQISSKDCHDENEVAWGFLQIAVEKMAAAIKKITIERGSDVRKAVLSCFGGAGGQHACLIAENLGIGTIVIHPLAGVLSALGIGLSKLKVVLHQSVQEELSSSTCREIKDSFDKLERDARLKLREQGGRKEDMSVLDQVLIRYQGSDTTLPVTYDCEEKMRAQFHETHHQRFGFRSLNKPLVVESLCTEATASPVDLPVLASALKNGRGIKTGEDTDFETIPSTRSKEECGEKQVRMYSRNRWWQARLFKRSSLSEGAVIDGPAIILDDTSTSVIEPGWSAKVAFDGSLILTFSGSNEPSSAEISKERAMDSDGDIFKGKTVDPIVLELFNNKFMAIAEEMGATLCHTSQSVNIKERLDFSCAVFDAQGQLIANAPHMPVHLGSMGESVRSIIDAFKNSMEPGDVYVLNNPYRGGTHLPDITVVTPVFTDGFRTSQDALAKLPDPLRLKAFSETPSRLPASTPLFFTASRGHHADIGGITPGSMPPASRSIEEEGVLIDPSLLVKAGEFQEEMIATLLTSGAHPSRNAEQNISDLKAQVAANNRGVISLLKLIETYGIETVQDYMHYVRRNAEDCVRDAIDRLSDGEFELKMDNGARIVISITTNKTDRSATVDFTGTSKQQESNLNAPKAITIAAVLYVFKTLVDENIPLNDGCLAPLNIIVPQGSMLNPTYPQPVVAGNVETSQAIVDALYGALNVMAASQGTMNNFTFGNDCYQYYETICGGSGAGPDHDGTDAVHTHMTNSRLTDPEVLEFRFPVIVKEFSIRRGSGGGGKHRGGDGVIRKLQFRENMQASILSQRRKIAPFGMKGGGSAKTGKNYVIRSDGTVEDLSGTATVEMQPDDTFVIETPGGGGWG